MDEFSRNRSELTRKNIWMSFPGFYMSHFLPVNVGHRQGKHSNVRMEERVLLLNLKGTLCILAGEVNRHTF